MPSTILCKTTSTTLANTTTLSGRPYHNHHHRLRHRHSMSSNMDGMYYNSYGLVRFSPVYAKPALPQKSCRTACARPPLLLVIQHPSMQQKSAFNIEKQKKKSRHNNHRTTVSVDPPQPSQLLLTPNKSRSNSRSGRPLPVPPPSPAVNDDLKKLSGTNLNASSLTRSFKKLRKRSTFSLSPSPPIATKSDKKKIAAAVEQQQYKQQPVSTSSLTSSTSDLSSLSLNEGMVLVKSRAGGLPSHNSKSNSGGGVCCNKPAVSIVNRITGKINPFINGTDSKLFLKSDYVEYRTVRVTWEVLYTIG